MPRARTSVCLMLLPLLGATACAGGALTVTGQSAGCASLISDNWRQGVEGADLPPVNATVGDWIAFGDEQTGRLDMANDRTVSTIGIVERCEERDRQAIERATRRRFLGLF
jgi:hypothetical protein